MVHSLENIFTKSSRPVKHVAQLFEKWDNSELKHVSNSYDAVNQRKGVGGR